MSFGKMRDPIQILRITHTKDADGFAQASDQHIANARAYFEQRHGNVRWANLARFSEATALFRLRVLPGVAIEPLHILVCRGERYEVLSVETLRGMYYEILAKEVL
ncbi:MAG: head-tail adaptor protein [Oscillospiraceae bacterium]|nr:head-tail adaptor protein [Oscillospiraceae bacterium]